MANKLLLAVIIIILIPILAVAAIVYYSWSLILSMVIWVMWGLKGRYILLVYSDSPIWSSYIKQDILPHIRQSTVVLNWSERKRWKNSLAVLAFKLYGGRRNYNPMAIVFRPFRLNKVFRFYDAFQDYKHGKPEKLKQTKMDFFKATEL